MDTVIEPTKADDGHPDLVSAEGAEFAIYAHNIWPELIAVVEAAKGDSFYEIDQALDALDRKADSL